MKKITKYLLMCALMPSMAFGMELLLCKTCRRHKRQPDRLVARLSNPEHQPRMCRLPFEEKCDELFFDGSGNLDEQLNDDYGSLVQRIKEKKLIHSIKMDAVLNWMSYAGLGAVTTAVGTLPELRSLQILITNFGRQDDARRELIVNMFRSARQLDTVDCSFFDQSLPDSRDLNITQLLDVIADKPITSLHLMGNQLLFCNVFLRDELVKALRRMAPTLKNLYIGHNPLGLFDAAAWHQLGPVLRNLKTLDIRRGLLLDPSMDESVWQAFADELMASEIEELDMELSCNWSNVPEGMWYIFVNMIAGMKRLRSINLGYTLVPCYRRDDPRHLNGPTRLSIKQCEALAEVLLNSPNHPTLIIYETDDLNEFWAYQRDERGLKVEIELDALR